MNTTCLISQAAKRCCKSCEEEITTQEL